MQEDTLHSGTQHVALRNLRIEVTDQYPTSSTRRPAEMAMWSAGLNGPISRILSGANHIRVPVQRDDGRCGRCGGGQFGGVEGRQICWDGLLPVSAPATAPRDILAAHHGHPEKYEWTLDAGTIADRHPLLGSRILFLDADE